MSIFHQNLEIRDTKRGKGVYSKVALPAGQIILEFKGEIIEKKNVKDYMEYLQITESTYLGLSGELDDYVNHSCSPNCGLKITGNRALLISLWDIKADAEITFDYSTSSNDAKDDWELSCLCGAFNCRKKISGYQHLSPEAKSFYENKKVVPTYLIGK